MWELTTAQQKICRVFGCMHADAVDATTIGCRPQLRFILVLMQNPHDFYKFDKELGRGKFGITHKVCC